MAEVEIDLDEEVPPLPKMSCKKADCGNNLHCFQRDKQQSKPVLGGDPCRECGAELVAWSRAHERRLDDAAFTFSVLRLEWVRHQYFHRPLTRRERNYALRKGRKGMRAAAEKRIRGSVGAAQPFKDGAQTPWAGHILYYAQHATASCCRTCIAEWHGIPAGRELTEDEVAYLSDLACLYVAERVPVLTEAGVEVPFVRRPRLPQKG